MANLTMDKLVALAKNRGFVFPGSEIYGGLANTWDYGPLGVELKNNIKKAWWKKFITESEYNVGLDCAILMNPKVWEASGHIGGFSDPLMDCKACKSRHRADDLIENWNAKKGITLNIAGWTNEQMEEYIREYPDFPVPAHYAHPIVLKRMQEILKEGRAKTIPEALQILKKDLKALNSDVVVEQEEYDEIVAIKPMFLVMDYK